MGKHNFRMPDIGEGIVDAEVVKWHISVGEQVLEDDPIADVMTDKATVEITSPVEGTVVSLGCDAGERITIGETLVEFSTAEATTTLTEESSLPANEPDVADRRERSATPAHTERVGQAPATTADVEPANVATRQPSSIPAAPTGRRLNTPRTEDKPHIRMRAEPEGSPRRLRVLASPAVRRRARELGIELAQVFGTGPDGRVLRTDLEAGAAERAALQAVARATPADAAAPSSQTPVTASPERTSRETGGDSALSSAPVADSLAAPEEQPLIGLRRIIAERLAESSRCIPHFTYVEEVDVTELDALRQHLNRQRDDALPRFSLLHFVLLAVCRAVAGWPQCNAHYDDQRNVLLRYPAVHLGVATMTDDGLMVPVIRDADSLDLDAMAAAVADVAARARTKRLPRERLSGSTITVTSLGTLAGITTTPIINRPETAIIGPNRMTGKLVMQNGRIVERQRMNISSSFDHRVVDGHDAASFIGELKALLEYPATLFL